MKVAKCHDGAFAWKDSFTAERVAKIMKLNEIVESRGQNMAQQTITWRLRLPTSASALIGASQPEQIEDVEEALDIRRA